MPITLDKAFEPIVWGWALNYIDPDLPNLTNM